MFFFSKDILWGQTSELRELAQKLLDKLRFELYRIIRFGVMCPRMSKSSFISTKGKVRIS